MKVSGILIDKGFHAFDHERHVHAGHVVPRVWIVVADMQKVHIWCKSMQGLQEIATAEFTHHPRHHGHHDMHEETLFVEEFSAWLASVRDQDVFDRIILVASKKMMGAFREHLPTDILACIAAEIPKDLTHMGKKQLEETLEKLIVI